MAESSRFPRVGLGSDLHRLLPDRDGFRLGGVWVSCGFGVAAHSDGDVLLHALADALLGAMAAGDIGDLFPDTAPENANQDSVEFLHAALDRVWAAGYRVGNVDLTLRLQRPKLAALKIEIREVLSKLLSIPIDCVSVKAKTGEGLDAVGRGEAIACEAAVLLLPCDA